MAHLFNQMHADTVKIEEIDHCDLINLIVVEFLSKMIQELRRSENDESQPDPWTYHENCLEMLTEEDRWFLFADRALNVINREHVWHDISEAFKFVKYLGLSQSQKMYFEKLLEANG